MVDLQPLFLSLKQALLQRGLSIDVYIFGSALYHHLPNDIDILIVYSIPDELPVIRELIFQISLEYPLDIYYMNPKEVSELEFIKLTKAAALTSLIRSK